MNPAAVESYKFADVVKLWARERLVHEVIVGRELARGFVVEGLRFQSADPKWVASSETMRGYPFVGYAAYEGCKPVFIRASALEHLLAVTRAQGDPNMQELSQEFVSRNDFRQWLIRSGHGLPTFWFGANERAA